MIHPSIHGQLGWDGVNNEVQYIISWENSTKQSDKATSLYGNINVVSEGRTSAVAVQTDYIPANIETTVTHPNGKFTVEVPAPVTQKRDLYLAVASGYGIDPPAGKMYVAGGVAYHITALDLIQKKEVRELKPQVIIRFHFSKDMDKSDLEVCQLDANQKWEPVNKDLITWEHGMAILKTPKLGTYALMIRNKVTMAEAVEAANLATTTLGQFIQVVKSSGNGSSNGQLHNVETVAEPATQTA